MIGWKRSVIQGPDVEMHFVGYLEIPQSKPPPDGKQGPSDFAHHFPPVMPNQPQAAIKTPDMKRKIALFGTPSSQQT